MVERHAVEHLHDDVRDPALLAVVVHRHDVPALLRELRRGLRFVEEALQDRVAVDVVEQRTIEEFDGVRRVEGGVVRHPDLPHSAAPEEPLEPVTASDDGPHVDLELLLLGSRTLHGKASVAARFARRPVGEDERLHVAA